METLCRELIEVLANYGLTAELLGGVTHPHVSLDCSSVIPPEHPRQTLASLSDIMNENGFQGRLGLWWSDVVAATTAIDILDLERCRAGEAVIVVLDHTYTLLVEVGDR